MCNAHRVSMSLLFLYYLSNSYRRTMLLSFVVISAVLSFGLCEDIIKNTICEECECLDPHVVDCNDLELDKFPKWKNSLDVPHVVDLIGNSITRIPVLPKMKNLGSLSFKYNLIKEVDDGAFINLPLLYTLDLSHNELDENNLSKDAFKGPYSDTLPSPMENLNSLNLGYNKFQRIPDRLFYHTPNLTILSLKGNQFVDLSVGSIQAFTEIPHLMDLDLSFCQLSRLPNHIFSDLRYLKKLDLSGNAFLTIPAEINFVPSLETLFLNQIPAEVVTRGSFSEQLTSLETLHLNDLPHLTTLQNYAFANLTGLRKLWVEGNLKLSLLEPFVFSSLYNSTLHIEEIHLQNNGLRSLPKEAVQWSDIDYLDLQHNPWHCDCNFEYIVDGLIKEIASKNREIVLDILCDSPPELMYQGVLNERVQLEEFKCYLSQEQSSKSFTTFFVVVSVLFGCFLFVAGVLLFAYLLYARAQKTSDWSGDRVKYRRAGPIEGGTGYF